ncbi:Pkinase-domain-containing protein, partial [Ramicandelaber brevisporus]
QSPSPQLIAPNTRPEHVRLGDFSIVRTVGTGSFSRVYLVKHKSTSQFYAIKRVDKADIIRLCQVEHINNERNILAMIRSNCPFIINLYGTFHDHRHLYFWLEYAPGGELFSHLKRYQRFPDNVARFYVSEIALALRYLHSLNIVYRDLKPENCMLSAHGHVLLTDFGFSKYVTDRTYTLCGTPSYISPEVIIGVGHSFPADWWALGVLIYELLVGTAPFEGESNMATYALIIENKLNFPAFIGEAARDLIRRLLEADLTMRLGNMQGGADDVLAHQWFKDGRFSWNDVWQRRIPPPIRPMHRFPGDSCNFDKYPE